MPTLDTGETVIRSATVPSVGPKSRYQPIGYVGELPIPLSKSVFGFRALRVSGKLTPAGSVAPV